MDLCGTTFVSIVSDVSVVSTLKKPICKSRKGRHVGKIYGIDIGAEITEEGANAHIDKMAKKYLGQDKYGFHQPGDCASSVKSHLSE